MSRICQLLSPPFLFFMLCIVPVFFGADEASNIETPVPANTIPTDDTLLRKTSPKDEQAIDDAVQRSDDPDTSMRGVNSEIVYEYGTDPDCDGIVDICGKCKGGGVSCCLSYCTAPCLDGVCVDECPDCKTYQVNCTFSRNFTQWATTRSEFLNTIESVGIRVVIVRASDGSAAKKRSSTSYYYIYDGDSESDTSGTTLVETWVVPPADTASVYKVKQLVRTALEAQGFINVGVEARDKKVAESTGKAQVATRRSDEEQRRTLFISAPVAIGGVVVIVVIIVIIVIVKRKQAAQESQVTPMELEAAKRRQTAAMHGRGAQPAQPKPKPAKPVVPPKKGDKTGVSALIQTRYMNPWKKK